MSFKKKKSIMVLSTGNYASGIVPTGSVSPMASNDQAANILSDLTEPYFSPHTTEVMGKIRELEKSTLSTSEEVYRKQGTLDERLFDARANVKILLSRVSMHFSNALREKLFHQIDLIHDPDDWEEDDIPIQSQSFNTFLRWFYLIQPQQLPNFGLSSTGSFIASWLTNHNKNSLVLEFLSDDQIRWFVTKYYDEDPDYSSGLTKLSRITELLSPYHTNDWFMKEAQ